VVAVHAIRPTLATVDREAAILLVAVLDRAFTNKIGHRLLGCGTERILAGLSRLEEHVAFTVRVELPGCISRRLDKIAFVLVNLRDVLDGASPRILHSDDFLLGDARVIRHRRVVQVDPHFPLTVEEVTERVLHLDLAALRGGEEIIAHGHCGVAGGGDIHVLPPDGLPALDGKATVLRANPVCRNEIRQGLVEGGPELNL